MHNKLTNIWTIMAGLFSCHLSVHNGYFPHLRSTPSLICLWRVSPVIVSTVHRKRRSKEWSVHWRTTSVLDTSLLIASHPVGLKPTCTVWIHEPSSSRVDLCLFANSWSGGEIPSRWRETDRRGDRSTGQQLESVESTWLSRWHQRCDRPSRQSRKSMDHRTNTSSGRRSSDVLIVYCLWTKENKASRISRHLRCLEIDWLISVIQQVVHQRCNRHADEKHVGSVFMNRRVTSFLLSWTFDLRSILSCVTSRE